MKLHSSPASSTFPSCFRQNKIPPWPRGQNCAKGSQYSYFQENPWKVHRKYQQKTMSQHIGLAKLCSVLNSNSRSVEWTEGRITDYRLEVQKTDGSRASCVCPWKFLLTSWDTGKQLFKKSTIWIELILTKMNSNPVQQIPPWPWIPLWLLSSWLS